MFKKNIYTFFKTKKLANEYNVNEGMISNIFKAKDHLAYYEY